jgi:hypothetical protein
MAPAPVLVLVIAVFVGAPGPIAPLAPRARQTAALSLDYEIFKSRVQPILISPRKGNARCIACHSHGGGSYLEPLAPGSATYTEDQTRRNFARVSRLVVPGEPLKSLLLTNPLDEAAGGSHWHGGGKHWHSQSDPEWQTLAAWVRSKGEAQSTVEIGSRVEAQSSVEAQSKVEVGSKPAPSALDYDVFKNRVQPILINARKGNARCTACHSHGGGNSYLEPLAPGSATYTEDQTRRNFERVSRLVVPGQPLKSILLTNPLDEAVGGSHWHGGGKHWHSQEDPEWQILAAWVSGT